jgi:endonuclease IV
MTTKSILKNGGLHISHNKISSIQTDDKLSLKFSAVQIFTFNPRTSNKPIKMDYKSVKSECEKNNLRLYIHASYIIPWKNVDITTYLIKEELKVAQLVGAKGIVVHLPKETISSIMPFIISLNKLTEFTPLIYLEFKALKSDINKTYETIEKFNKLSKALEDNKIDPKKIQICLDSAHLYSSGVNEVKLFGTAEKYLDSLSKTYIGLIHLNGNEFDNKEKARDKHAIPFDSKDKIWGGIKFEESGCKAFMNYAIKNNIDYILEIKDSHSLDEVNIFMKLL